MDTTGSQLARGAIAGASSGRGPSAALIAVLLVAAVVRFGVYLAFPAVFDFVASRSIHGSTAFDTYALNLLHTRTYGLEPGVPDAALPPGYGFVLAGAYSLLGRSGLTVAALHTTFDLLAIVLLASIGARLFRDPAVGVLAGLGFACYPYLVFQGLAVNDTALFILELNAMVWLVLRLDARLQAARRWVTDAGLAGAVLGVGVLTRPVLLVVGAGLALWLVVRLPRRTTLQGLAVVALAATLPLAAWALRNEITLGHPVLVATNGGSNFWQGNNAETVPYLRAGYDVQWISPGALAGLDARDPEAGRRFVAAALSFLRAHPERIPGLLWTKLLTQWSLDVSPRRNPTPGPEAAARGEPDLGGVVVEPAVAAYSEPLFERVGRTVHRITWGVALVLACVGFVAARRARLELAPIWIVEGAMTLFYVAFHPSTRYRAPGDPLLFLVSAFGALVLIDAARRRSATTIRTGESSGLERDARFNGERNATG